MLGLTSSYTLEVLFHQRRAISLLNTLTTSSDLFVKCSALKTLAEVHLSSVSCDPEATHASRLHGLTLLSSAFSCGSSSPPSSPLHSLSVQSGRLISQIYEEGSHSIPVSFEKSSDWMRRCAEYDHVESLCDYALTLEMGVGDVDGDEAEAFKYYEKAGKICLERNEMHEETFEALGDYYENGRSIPPNLTKAVEWYRRGEGGGCRRGRERLKDIERIMGY
ncbi:hypothetical protein TrST_g2601 [Triparma strigata]|uniref:HCP-like protein n=1 Tax=Triparma strigata TaxID=1606541 RepID=A0A9W7AED4_9STRA|nr:hypothetical protein TrST_g2601 [Triparma strigata]